MKKTRFTDIEAATVAPAGPRKRCGASRSITSWPIGAVQFFDLGERYQRLRCRLSAER